MVWLPSILFSQKCWEFHHPNWLSHFSEGLKPPTSSTMSISMVSLTYSELTYITKVWDNLMGMTVVRNHIHLVHWNCAANVLSVELLEIRITIWLVVWNIFYFPIYWEFHHPNWLSYFSEGFKPPTSYGLFVKVREFSVTESPILHRLLLQFIWAEHPKWDYREESTNTIE